ncbi:uncharacterized protein HD556DRAFT_1367342 [Suillus plorans]|uniref:Uncharacterized protein n=1 Tax=Suillus plorans TaxID=116603 RepID=A0A9P7AT12_9AGAM|nr:uncharacterized protein HD556DRAFT_1367342 [Suillus plorans]KAG1794848.1 hypothetical protein HD556DRAFT_1367342 [Suillus plorans]
MTGTSVIDHLLSTVQQSSPVMCATSRTRGHLHHPLPSYSYMPGHRSSTPRSCVIVIFRIRRLGRPRCHFGCDAFESAHQIFTPSGLCYPHSQVSWRTLRHKWMFYPHSLTSRAAFNHSAMWVSYSRSLIVRRWTIGCCRDWRRYHSACSSYFGRYKRRIRSLNANISSSVTYSSLDSYSYLLPDGLRGFL